ncbi:unnamed protein product [Adineta steineri]|uniref:RBR-type E3 ubiquitin transferase n=1 Tax=Adineta steineri TaxID=433720 RepID=A0A818LZG2_9BILA|nr:unnamed protein product [Adineta steineri]
MTTRTIGNEKLKCGLCAAYIDQAEYRTHVIDCGVMKKCALCGQQVSNLANHYEKCTGGYNNVNDVDKNRSKSQAPRLYPTIPTYTPSQKITKKCAVCSMIIDEKDYINHLDTCNVELPKTNNTKKKCIICTKEINEIDYVKHVDACLNPQTVKESNTEECIICSKAIIKSELVKHVNECLSKSSVPKSTPIHAQKSCFTCSSPVTFSKNSSHTIPCQSSHIYCLKCLQRSMNEYIQSNNPPICHSALCDYELSRYDISCLPLEANTIQQLLTSVKNTQRSQCPICLFYVEFNTMGDLEKHVASCNPENMIPCEHCHCLYNIHRLDSHSQQCRNVSRSQQQQTLIDFILPRTKYPVTGPQIRVFIEERKKRHLSLDPHSIVDTLATLGATFPFDVPTRDCDICMESHIYDDIFVFGCNDSHKLCYGCFADSCTAKMNNNEILTCALCTYQLQYGEIKQLRIPTDQAKEFLEYQTQKTFNSYSDNTQAVIKCPNQGCKWIAEVQNPNERFQVTCPLCNYQFCSLCSQQYHFRTTCQQIPEITQRWFFWCNTERGNYWQARAQQDATFRAQLEDYERQRGANEQRNIELRQRYDELLADETYKAQNCRLCPNCRRVVQHLSGCDAMICGQNYHGGDVQSGCGQRFNWSQATPYAPIGNTGPEQVRNDVPPPEQQKTVVHAGVQCDSCRNELQGIRFDCIHCSSLIFCEKCEQNATLEHSNQIRDQQKQQHVFQLIFRPSNENNG